jgi:hypothetical protein
MCYTAGPAPGIIGIHIYTCRHRLIKKLIIAIVISTVIIKCDKVYSRRSC